jgi:cyclohexanecarboxylate-CoA ligase
MNDRPTDVGGAAGHHHAPTRELKVHGQKLMRGRNSAAPGPVPYLPFSYLAWNAARRPEAAAVIDPERTLGFLELQLLVEEVARRLPSAGLRSGVPVAVQLPNVWEYVALELAIPHSGGVVMPLPLNLGPAEVARALDSSSASALITYDAEEHRTAIELARGRGLPVVDARELCSAPGAGAGADAVRTWSGEEGDPDVIVEIALTSGTTGMPKLAALSARLKQATFEGFTERLEVVPADRVLVMSPLMQGIGGMCLFCLRRGAALVMVRESRFSPAWTLEVAARTRSTLLVGVPTNVIRMLQSPALARTDLSAARCTAVAGSPMPPDVARRWEETTGSHVVSFYGSMDAGQLAVGRPSDSASKRWHTVGKPHDCAEWMICDADGRAVAPGEVGEICMRGPTVQERYWGEQRGPFGEDGWAHMGDLGKIDHDGYLQVVGRLKDIVIRGGTNINPYEVEDHLRSHPAVRDVCVVGRPDRELGERAVAFVVGELSLPAMRDHLRERGLARYKWPEDIVPIEEIPLSGPGKVNRRLLKEMASAENPLR